MCQAGSRQPGNSGALFCCGNFWGAVRRFLQGRCAAPLFFALFSCIFARLFSICAFRILPVLFNVPLCAFPCPFLRSAFRVHPVLFASRFSRRPHGKDLSAYRRCFRRTFAVFALFTFYLQKVNAILKRFPRFVYHFGVKWKGKRQKSVKIPPKRGKKFASSRILQYHKENTV